MITTFFITVFSLFFFFIFNFIFISPKKGKEELIILIIIKFGTVLLVSFIIFLGSEFYFILLFVLSFSLILYFTV